MECEGSLYFILQRYGVSNGVSCVNMKGGNKQLGYPHFANVALS
jgi:hypothetical protein